VESPSFYCEYPEITALQVPLSVDRLTKQQASLYSKALKTYCLSGLLITLHFTRWNGGANWYRGSRSKFPQLFGIRGGQMKA